MKELLLKHLFPDDDPQKDTDRQKEARRHTKQPINTADDKQFTQDEVRQLVEVFKDKKTPGPNGITNEIVKKVFQAIPKIMTRLYNACLKSGHFPEKMEDSKVPNDSQTGERRRLRPVNVETN